jgi:hypothetical protein
MNAKLLSRTVLIILYILLNLLLTWTSAHPRPVQAGGESPVNEQGERLSQIDGYRGIWFTLGQFTEYGDKYSGGLGTYTAKHIPLAIYSPEVNKTFFVYGGTTGENERHLLCMIGAFDHADNSVSKPVIVYDKEGVDDPHDNPSISIDSGGHIWVFVSGRGEGRPGLKFKSKKPYDICHFEKVTEETFTYPQPWYNNETGFFHFFTKYTGLRELYFETSENGHSWSPGVKLASIKRTEDERAGHYQVSNQEGNKIGTFFNWHPDGDVNLRTNLYYIETSDNGASWTTVDGETVQIPVSELESNSLVMEYYSKGKRVYLKDVNFDALGNPICLYITSSGHEPGPDNDPREWRISWWNGEIWENHIITTSDHNYDMGSLFVEGAEWTIVAPSVNPPQLYGAGGEIEIIKSNDQGKGWQVFKQITQNSSRNHNYVRRVVQGKAPFHFFWADGDPDKFSISKLYIGDLSGNVYELPYVMEEQSQVIIPVLE